MIDWKSKKVLVTGACGTIGSELVKQLLVKQEVRQLVGIDNNESELFFFSELYKSHDNAEFFLEDIRDRLGLIRRLQDVDIVFHAAAFKHVILCERTPRSAVETNINGVSNVIWAVLNSSVEKVIFTSSDKAVNPTNVMGTSKLMGERLFAAANADVGKETVFASTRFGNVMGSRGSVIPIFKRQIMEGGPVTLTHQDMSRFIMSIEEAVRLVIDSAVMAKGGEVFVTKMPTIGIKDLAEVMIEELAPRYGRKPGDIPVEIIGAKPGEKLYEELMTGEETGRACELERYFVIKPAFLPNFKQVSYDYPGVVSDKVDTPYVSSSLPRMSKDEIADFLVKNQLL